MNEKYFAEKAAAYEAEAKELEAAAIMKAKYAISAIEEGDFKAAVRMLYEAAGDANGAGIDIARMNDMAALAEA